MTTLTLSKVKLVNKGTYSNTATYSEGDIVTYQGTSFVYKSNTAATGAPLFLETYSGNITSAVVNTSNIVNITFSGTFTTNTSLEPIVTGEHFIYSAIFEPGTKIKTINSKSGNTWSLTLTEGAIKNWANSTNNIPVVVSARRVANRTETVINNKHWDRLSAGMNFKGAWATATTYLEGDLVSIDGNTYLCTSAHDSIHPLWDNSGVWEPFSLGNHRKPQNRITNKISTTPFNWRGHPYVPNPNWGTANTYTGIPWNLPDAVKNSVHAPQWNEGVNRGIAVYRGEATFIDGEGHLVGHGGAGYNGMPGYTARISEIGAQHIWDYYADHSRQIGGKKAFNEHHTPPKTLQHLTAWSHRMSVISNGQLTYAGSNGYGESGYGNSTDISAMRAQISLDSRFFDGRKIVKATSNCVKARSGYSTFILLDEFGEVWTAGYGGNWMLGDVSDNSNPTANTSMNGTQASAASKYTYTKLPKEIKFDNKRIVDIWAGYYHFVALDESGRLWSWGYNGVGQLGYRTDGGGSSTFSNTSYSKTPFLIPVDWSLYGGIQKVVVNGGNGTYDSTWVLDGQGHIWNCGANGLGQLGRGNTTSDTNASTITRTSYTASWTIAGSIRNFWLTGDDGGTTAAWFLDSNNKLWGVGFNGHRILSTNSTTNQSLPVQAYGPKGEMTNIVTMTSNFGSGGISHYCLDADGQPYSTGYNAFGECGVGHASYVDLGTGYTRNCQYGQSVGASWQRPSLPNTFHKKIVDIIAFGDYEATAGYGHCAYTYWLTDTGELVTCGETNPASARQNPFGTAVYNPTSPQF